LAEALEQRILAEGPTPSPPSSPSR
jgi:hypothetical protein